MPPFPNSETAAVPLLLFTFAPPYSSSVLGSRFSLPPFSHEGEKHFQIREGGRSEANRIESNQPPPLSSAHGEKKSRSCSPPPTIFLSSRVHLLASLNLLDDHLPALLGGTDHGTLMSGLSHESQFLKQTSILVEGRIVGGEQRIAVEDGIGPGRKHHELLGVAEAQASGGETHHGAGHDDPRRGDHARHVEGVNAVDVDVLSVAEGSALDADQGVDGDALGMLGKGGQYVEQSHPILFLLPQAQDSSAAHADTRVSHVGDGIETILVAPRGDDVGIMLGTRIEIVIVGRQSGILELLGLLRVEHAEGAAHLQTHAVDSPHHFENVIEGVLFAPQFAPRRAHAESRGSGVLGLLGGLEDFLDLHGRGGLDEGLVTGGLRAVRTILGAPPRLDRQ
mmetsp:Transcript_28529/g.83972  ORF Transcript_28529/g.83972 Transcript_28529/m.83972 type:complete len:394 (-) Transcript_28529:656-1837(-)